MVEAESFHEYLCRKNHSGVLLCFHDLCRTYNVVPVKVELPDGFKAVTIRKRNAKFILLSDAIGFHERRSWAWHELYHALHSPRLLPPHRHAHECKRADLFAALCRIPYVLFGDTACDLVGRFHVPLELAQLRIERLREKGLETDDTTRLVALSYDVPRRSAVNF